MHSSADEKPKSKEELFWENVDNLFESMGNEGYFGKGDFIDLRSQCEELKIPTGILDKLDALVAAGNAKKSMRVNPEDFKKFLKEIRPQLDQIKQQLKDDAKQRPRYDHDSP